MERDPNVVVTGAGGQVGKALKHLNPHYRYLMRAELDVCSPRAVLDVVRPADVVVHLAAMTLVDLCEERPEDAHAINSNGTLNVVEAARHAGARTIYLSTDYVFDGTKDGEYSEDDLPRPLNVYGTSKLEGERHTLQDPENLVIRTSWVFGEGKNFVKAIVSAAERTRLLRVVDDQRGRPTYAGDIARALEHAIVERPAGILHVAGAGPPCSWADLAEHALSLVGSPGRVERVTTEDYERESGRVLAPRPRNSALALDKAMRRGVPLGAWMESLREYMREPL